MGRWKLPWNHMKGTKGCMIPVARNACGNGRMEGRRQLRCFPFGAGGTWDELDLSMRQGDL
ncbi:hypothetical protein GQ53DRAFT_747261 [Thozetella sp. PMI_491]|nr:hypothetical protein GQ53DRAFT_747261 [Thozetella sp. PMI_491]